MCHFRVAIRLGDGDLSERFGIQVRTIRKRAVHPQYEGRSRRLDSPYYDVAVLTMNREADVAGGYVRPICLPYGPSENVDRYVGQQVDVAGKV